MAIDDERKTQILRYYFAEHWRVGTIARQLGVHHSSVERVLGEAGVERERQRPRRPSMLDPYLPFITETLQRFPTLSAARPDTGDAAAFRRVGAPGRTELDALLEKISHRVGQYLERAGLLVRDIENSYLSDRRGPARGPQRLHNADPRAECRGARRRCLGEGRRILPALRGRCRCPSASQARAAVSVHLTSGDRHRAPDADTPR